IKIHLNKKKRKKVKVHQLTPAHIQNRKTTHRKLYEKYLAGQRSEFVVTLDEAFFYIDDCHGKRRICYVKKSGNIPPNWVFPKKKFGKKFMAVGVMSGRGVLPIIRVPPRVKISSQFYIDKVLKPLVEVHIPALLEVTRQRLSFIIIRPLPILLTKHRN